MVECSLHSLKQQIKNQFDKHALHYQHYSELQLDVAAQLAKILKELTPHIPEGPILEIGAGIGGLTTHLTKLLKNRYLHITDLSANMLKLCAINIETQNVKQLPTFAVMDGEFPATDKFYAAIVSGMAFQWFENLEEGVKRLYDQLLPNGILVFSFPEEQSFPEWRELCQQLQVPYTGHPLPKEQNVLKSLQKLNSKMQINYQNIPCLYSKPSDFFYRLIKIGAGFTKNTKQLTIEQMKKLLKVWSNQEKIKVTYRIGYAWIQKS